MLRLKQRNWGMAGNGTSAGSSGVVRQQCVLSKKNCINVFIQKEEEYADQEAEGKRSERRWKGLMRCFFRL